MSVRLVEAGATRSEAGRLGVRILAGATETLLAVASNLNSKHSSSDRPPSMDAQLHRGPFTQLVPRCRIPFTTRLCQVTGHRSPVASRLHTVVPLHAHQTVL